MVCKHMAAVVPLLRAEGLCVFCGRNPAASLCRSCRDRQNAQVRERYRAAVEREGRTVRPYRRKSERRTMKD